MRDFRSFNRLLVRFALLALATSHGSSLAQEHHKAATIQVGPQPLETALQKFSEQSGLQVAYVATLAENVTSKGTQDAATPVEALAQILDSTGLEYQFVNDDTVAIVPAADKGGDSELGNGRPAAAMPRSMMMAQATTEQRQTSRRPETDSDTDEITRTLEEIVVTGTRIKGVEDQFSPVRQFSREEMDLAGFNNVSDIFESLPQNFGAGSHIDTFSASPGNGTGNASVNLRGLGNQATLILLNGRRLAPGGAGGNFVDISSIPASAIDRVDVLTDGASAIYGSDAIAGVVNIILRDDFDGAETRLNVGAITDGGGDYLKAGQTLGWSGDRAHAMLTYEYSDEEELDANQKKFAANAVEPTWLLPSTRKHSVFASAGAQLSDRITLSANGLFNDRKSKQFTTQDTTSFRQDFTTSDVQQYGGALGLDVELGGDWDANLSGNYSKSDNVSTTVLMNDFRIEQFTAFTEIAAFDGSVGGPLLNISDDPVRGVVGAHYRTEEVDLMRSTSTSGVLNDVDKSRNVFAAFGEIYAPIVSDANRMPGVENLALSAAVRYEEYSDVGSSLVPKVGLSWSPTAGLNFRGTYGKSFRAPRLDLLRDIVSGAVLSLFVDPIAPDGESVALVITGSRDDLDPERSRTWTAGFDFAPNFLDGLLVRGTYFNTVFTDQVGGPSLTIGGDFSFTHFTGLIIRDASPETALDFCARATICANLANFNPALGDFTFEDTEVILDQRRQNLSLSKVAGFDFEGNYDLTSAIGDWRFSLGGTLLTTFEQQVAPVAPVENQLNTFRNPVDLKLRGGGQLRTGAITTAIFVNHVGDYIDDEAPIGNVPISSWTTVDATLRLDLEGLGDSPLIEGATLSFSVLNMLNEDPPLLSPAPLRRDTFDTANANPAGRKVGLLLTKRW